MLKIILNYRGVATDRLLDLITVFLLWQDWKRKGTEKTIQSSHQKTCCRIGKKISSQKISNLFLQISKLRIFVNVLKNDQGSKFSKTRKRICWVHQPLTRCSDQWTKIYLSKILGTGWDIWKQFLSLPVPKIGRKYAIHIL